MALILSLIVAVFFFILTFVAAVSKKMQDVDPHFYLIAGAATHLALVWVSATTNFPALLFVKPVLIFAGVTLPLAYISIKVGRRLLRK